jgi:diacylglycerol kinase (ATP)
VHDYTFILNPMAGKGSGRKADRLLEALLRGFGMKFKAWHTEAPGHATQLARQATTSHVVAVGGDGTINEVVNGLAGTDKIMGIIPTGSGNDFIKSIGVPHAMKKALQVLLNGHVRTIDVGRVQTGRSLDGSMKYAPARLFVNGVGIGFDAAVARRVSEITGLRGTALYLLAVLQTLGRYRAPEFTVRADAERWNRRQLLIAVGNGRCAGGGFYLTPDAKVDDGVLDVTVIEDVPILTVLRLIPGVMAGKPVKNACVSYKKVNELEVTSSEEFNVHADGEIVGREVHGVRLEIVPGALKVVAG